jgi:hypothetical protein
VEAFDGRKAYGTSSRALKRPSPTHAAMMPVAVLGWSSRCALSRTGTGYSIRNTGAIALSPKERMLNALP